MRFWKEPQSLGIDYVRRLKMGNCDPLIFLRQDCQLPGVRFNFHAVSDRGTADSSRENADNSFGPDENVLHLEGSEPHGMVAQIGEDLFLSKRVAVRAHE